MRPVYAALARGLLILSLPAFASSALAQQTTDWDLRQDPRSGLTVAYIAFDSGLAIGARCTDDGYQVAISGLPPATADTRPLRIGFNGETAENQTWYVATNKATAISGFPARFARQLRAGGRLDIVAPGAGEGGRNLRYVMTLPTSGAAIDTSLRACSRPLVDPRDSQIQVDGDGLPDGLNWALAPRASYPAAESAAGFATLSCLSQADGRVRDCVVEAEYPPRAGFGRAALRGMNRARLANTEDPSRPLVVQMVTFTVNFCLDGFCPGQRRDLPTGSRLPVTSPDG